MAFLNPLRTPKHQRFNYIPRYWDEEKEDLEARVRQADPNAESKFQAQDMKMRISRGFSRRSSMKGMSYGSAEKKMNKRLFVIIGGLILISYILIDRYIPAILKILELPN